MLSGSFWVQISFQMTSCIRNVLNSERGREEFLSANSLSTMDDLCRKFIDSPEIMCNLARIYSVLSLNRSSSKSAASFDGASVECLLSMTKAHSTKQELVVRTTFALGNLAAEEEERKRLAKNTDLFEFLPRFLRSSIDVYLPPSNVFVTQLINSCSHISLSTMNPFKHFLVCAAKGGKARIRFEC